MSQLRASYVFHHNPTGIWSSPNAPALRTPVPPAIDVQPGTPLKIFSQPQWLNPLYPYLAFWPISHPSSIFSGPIFRRLNIANDNLPIVKHSEIKYSLSQELITTWERLENALYGLVVFLLQRRLGFSNIPILFLFRPQECGYTSTHAQEKFVRFCAFKSRDAFKGLMAASSFAIALNTTPEDAARPEPDWVTACRAKGVNSQWLDDLRRTIVCQFDPGVRSGCYVDGYNPAWSHHFPAFVHAKVPVWISWGQTPRLTKNPYFPEPDQTKEAFAASRSVALSGSILSRSSTPQFKPAIYTADPRYDPPHHDEPGDVLSSPGPSPCEPEPRPVDCLHLQAQRDPELHRGSRQRCSETMEQFHSRMIAEEAEYEQNESPEDHIERRAREEKALSEAYNTRLSEPTFGTALYQWIRKPSGATVRTFVPRIEWANTWRMFAAPERIYYGFLDEWDLNLASHSGGGDHDSDSSLESLMVDADEIQAFAPREMLLKIPDPFKASVEDAQHIYAADVPTSTVSCSPLVDVLHLRYGFLVTVPYSIHPLMEVVHRQTPGIHTQKRAGMLPFALKGYENDPLANAVLDLNNFILDNTRVDGARPYAFPPIWDFKPTLGKAIREHHKYRYHRVGHGLHLIGIADTPLHKQWYVLGLYDACDALFVFRDLLRPKEEPDTFLRIVRILISHGINFSTPKFLPDCPSQPRVRRGLGLGYRPKNHRFDIQEYRAYEHAKRDILTSSLGRAALMRGGIVWRLSRDIVRPKTVTAGVVASSLRNEGSVVASLGSFYLVDQLLSDEDEDTICGVYHIYTGVGRDQVSQSSWWPKTNTWLKSGYNVGYWSIDCENFYQRRLEELRKGASPMTASDWRGRLKQKSTYTGKLTRYMSDISDMLLKGDNRHWA